MKSKANRSNRWFIIISILVIISMVCGFASMLRGNQDVDTVTVTPSYTTAPSRTPQPVATNVATLSPTPGL